jgi:hypothetical protein
MAKSDEPKRCLFSSCGRKATHLCIEGDKKFFVCANHAEMLKGNDTRCIDLRDSDGANPENAPQKRK